MDIFAQTTSIDCGRKPIPVKWVFKIKDEANEDKRLKCRAVVKGFHMIPGVDYTEKFSPVTTDTSTRIMLGLTPSFFSTWLIVDNDEFIIFSLF